MERINRKKQWIGFAAAAAGCLLIGLCIVGCSAKTEELIMKSETAEESQETLAPEKTITVTPKPEIKETGKTSSAETERKKQKKEESSSRPAAETDKNELTESEQKTETIVPVKKEEPEKTPETKPEEEKPEAAPAAEEPQQGQTVSEPEVQPAEEHHHSYYIVSEVAPTCTSPGKRTYACSCGLIYDDSISMLDHDWVPVTEVIHHDAEIKPDWDEVISEAWDEPVYESHSICNGCGIDLDLLEQNGADRGDHIWDEHDGTCGWHDENVQVDTIHHEAETVHHPEEVISQAWDEEVVTGYRCSVCGTAK